MKGEIYIVPVGMFGENLITTVDILIKDASVAINPESGISLVNEDELKEKYDNLKCVSEIEIDEEISKDIQELKTILESKEEKELKILEKIGPSIQEEIEKIQNEPQIHIPTLDEVNDFSGKQGSRIIFEE